MKVDGKPMRTLWPALRAATRCSSSTSGVAASLGHRTPGRRGRRAQAIRDDVGARGAPLIGATAAYGLALQCSRASR